MEICRKKNLSDAYGEVQDETLRLRKGMLGALLIEDR